MKVSEGDEIFEKEIALCKQLCRDNDGSCHWGVCQSCGVIPLLYKLCKGTLLEDLQQIKDVKDLCLNPEKE